MNWDSLLGDCTDFARRLIQTPSMTGDEAAVAALIAAEMEGLGFDEVWLDEIGNICGRVYGQDRNLDTIVLNSHTDHVDPGDLGLWQTPPYAAEIRDGRILGRGACDIKGPLAVQIYGLAALLREGERPRRDVVFTGVVAEEVGGAGANFWAQNVDYPVALVVLGEPSSNQLSLGHRGIVQMWLTFPGRSVHASVPEKGTNPNYMLAEFLARLQESEHLLREHPVLGRSSVAPTIVEVDTKSMNVTPAWTRVLLDFRTAAESSDSLQRFVHQVAGDLPHLISDAWGKEPKTPLPDSDEIVFGYYTAPDTDLVGRVRELIAAGMGWEPALRSYQFATDGRHFAPFGMPILGYSPGEEALAHTVNESISLAMMADGLRGYYRLLREF